MEVSNPQHPGTLAASLEPGQSSSGEPPRSGFGPIECPRRDFIAAIGWNQERAAALVPDDRWTCRRELRREQL